MDSANAATPTPQEPSREESGLKPVILRGPAPFEHILDYYVKAYYCANCGTHQSVSILKGFSAPARVNCKNCECLT